MSEKTIYWQAPEFRHYPKNTAWYITLIAVALLIVGFFVIVESDIFAATCLGIITILVVIFAKQTPQVVEIELNNKGLRFGHLLYPYKQIRHFWLVYNENHKTLNFYTTAMFNNLVVLQIEDQDPEQLREFLIKYLPEHEQTHETVTQRLMHLFKF